MSVLGAALGDHQVVIAIEFVEVRSFRDYCRLFRTRAV
jgi:hypothetical protein